MTAGLGVILDSKTRTQVVFGGGEEKISRIKPQKGDYGHSDDIVSLTMSDDRKFVATG
jgi:hypothetical protein